MIAPSATLLSLALSASATFHGRRSAGQLVTSCTVANTVALTFDDGPYLYTTDMVDTMKSAGAKGTFFVDGDNWGCIYDEAMAQKVKYAYDNGFQIASHTWSHKDLTTLAADQIDSEMSRAEGTIVLELAERFHAQSWTLHAEAIKKIIGCTPAFTRPPYGSYNDLVLEVAGARSQTVVNWDLDSGDSQSFSADQQKKVYDDAVAGHPNTILSLQHEVYDSSAHDVLPYAISLLQSAGYQLVTLAECLGQEPYSSTGAPAERDATWECVKG